MLITMTKKFIENFILEQEGRFTIEELFKSLNTKLNISERILIHRVLYDLIEEDKVGYIDLGQERKYFSRSKSKIKSLKEQH